MLDNSINIVLTSSDIYASYTSVTIASILSNTPQNRNIKFYIITEDFSDKNKQLIEWLKSIHDFEIEYKYINCKELNLPIAPQSRVSNIAYARLLIGSLFPNLKKCIICDSDLVFNHNIAELYDIDLENKIVSIAADPLQREGKDYWWEQLNVSPQYPYLNTGVILADVEKFRKHNIEKNIFENYGIYRYQVHFIDQDLLYMTLSNNNKLLDSRWNYLPNIYYTDTSLKNELKNNAFVYHFGGGAKPWISENVEYFQIWWKYAKLSPFYEKILCNLLMSKEEMFKKHFCNINKRFENTEQMLKWNFVINHMFTFKLKKIKYKLKTYFSLGIKSQKNYEKYKSISKKIKEAKKYKKQLLKYN